LNNGSASPALMGDFCLTNIGLVLYSPLTGISSVPYEMNETQVD
jgi:hypothetical protein